MKRKAETQGKGLDVPHGFTRGPDVAVGFTPKAEDKSGARWRELVCGTGTEFLLTYGANSDGSSEDGGDRPSAEDHFN
ncbi:hypothetical protein RJ639_021101 [Escallonia herrerae]|uniref:Uncharacterized protein n=1 Tax=Escallonia herrerae TaxID=1293975 RepID=A0AA89AGB8_9ASTE|nr:hypothetical protein RJ639_021101 [Escallonia herrerae]